MSTHADRRRRIREWVATERAAGRIQRETCQHAAERCATALGMPVTAIELRQQWHALLTGDVIARSARAKERMQ